jgi:hypothetical protein
MASFRQRRAKKWCRIASPNQQYSFLKSCSASEPFTHKKQTAFLFIPIKTAKKSLNLYKTAKDVNS